MAMVTQCEKCNMNDICTLQKIIRDVKTSYDHYKNKELLTLNITCEKFVPLTENSTDENESTDDDDIDSKHIDYCIKKYEIIRSDRILYMGIPVYRIRALRDIPRYGIKAGDLGGYIESENNLSNLGDCWIGNSAIVCKNAIVCDDAIVSDYAEVYNNAVICDEAEVLGSKAKVFDFARISGHAKIYNSAKIFGGSTISGHITVSGLSKICTDECIDGDYNIHDLEILK